MNMIHIFLLLFLCSIGLLDWYAEAAAGRDGTAGGGGLTYVPVNVGVVLNLNSTLGTMAEVCISMALEDFYLEHPDYQTRLVLHTKDAQEELDVVSQVLELLKSEDIHGILGPQTLTEDTFAAELGRKAQVPLISFTSRGQSLSHAKNPYFIRTTPHSSNQLKALAKIIKKFEWPEAVILYEETDDGNQFTSKLWREFLMADIQLVDMIAISALAADHHIKKELENLMTIQTRVFIVHMNAMLGGRLFVLAKRAGMMSKGYAWLITDSLGNCLNSIDSTAFDSMEGVLGIRPHVPKSAKLESFKERWKKKKILSKSTSKKVVLNVYGLWAYDAVWALATVVEKIGPVNASFWKLNNGKNGTDISNLKSSQFGPKLLGELYNTSFAGLSGKFQLADGKLKSSDLEIFNIVETGAQTIGGGRPIGYWRPDGRITRKSASRDDSRRELTILWPGDSFEKPVGRSSPAMPKLKVIIPNKTGFTEFVNVARDPVTKQIHPTGFVLDFFLSTVQLLHLKFDLEFFTFNPKETTYSDLISSLPNKDLNIMVGDTTILADRARSADFSLPYMDSGVVCVVKNKQEKSMWNFLRPFGWDLWLTYLASYPIIASVIWIMECRANQNPGAAAPQRRGVIDILWLPIASLGFFEGYQMANKWSRFVLLVWGIMSFVLWQGYNANYPKKSTEDHLDFKFSQDHYIGYQEGSFVRDLLINRWHVSELKLRQYTSVEEYDAAMTKGGKNGGIDVIVDETPYMKLLLSRYGSKYKMLRQMYRTDGFSFAFLKDSELVALFSRAILDVKEGPNMTRIEEMNFGPGYSSENQQSSDAKNSGFTVYEFAGLFIIAGGSIMFALLCAVTPIIRWARDFYGHCLSFMPFGGSVTRTTSTASPGAGQVQPSAQNNTNPGMNHQQGQGNSGALVGVSEGNESGVSNDTRTTSTASSSGGELQLSEQNNTNSRMDHQQGQSNLHVSAEASVGKESGQSNDTRTTTTASPSGGELQLSAQNNTNPGMDHQRGKAIQTEDSEGNGPDQSNDNGETRHGEVNHESLD